MLLSLSTNFKLEKVKEIIFTFSFYSPMPDIGFKNQKSNPNSPKKTDFHLVRPPSYQMIAVDFYD